MTVITPEVSKQKQQLNKVFLAKVWYAKGKDLNAITILKNLLEENPRIEQAYELLTRFLCLNECWHELNLYAKQGLGYFPNNAELHKRYIQSMLATNGHKAAFEAYGMVRKDHHQIDLNPDAIICCLVIRNERLRLPYFLKYYRALGIKHFFVIDNDSDDTSLDFLLDQEDVYIWTTKMSFNQANFGSAWFEVILQKYGIGHWCLTLDADELLTFHGAETAQLYQLCDELDRQGKMAASGVLLDMYSDKPLKETVYVEGQDFLDVCTYFDKEYYHEIIHYKKRHPNQPFHFGGVRKRVFGGQLDFLLTKTPLLKYQTDTVLAGGQHFTNFPAEQIAHQQICVLHFKYFSSLIKYTANEVIRGEHCRGAMQYKAYHDKITGNEELTLFKSAYSIRYLNTQQLIDLGVILLGLTIKAPTFVEIPALKIPVSDRPFWSVVITVYDRLSYLEEVIKSVLLQGIPLEEMEIIVLSDGMKGAFQTKLTEIIARFPENRIRLECLPKNLGHPYIFNKAIELTCGQWVHILHDDDLLYPGFYKSLSVSIKNQPTIGAAFTRHVIQNRLGKVFWKSWIERSNPGIIEHWEEKITKSCRLQFSSMVVKRTTYETIGGFYDQVGSAFDWEMWKRIAVKFPVWFEPQIHVGIIREGQALTDELEKNGGQILDSLSTISLSQNYLQADKADFLSQFAKERLAHYGINKIESELENEDYKSILLNIRSILKADCSKKTTLNLINVLSQI